MWNFVSNWIWPEDDNQGSIEDPDLLEELDLLDKEKPEEIVRTGILTELLEDNGVIDDQLFFPRTFSPKICFKPLAVGDQVQYKATRKSANQQWVITELLHNYGHDAETWFDDSNSNQPSSRHFEDDASKIRSKDVGKVVQVESGHVLVEMQAEYSTETLSFPRNYLDFQPQPGDLLGLDLILPTEFLDDVKNAQILKASPLRTTVITHGVVTSWWSNLKKGLVDFHVYFGAESFTKSYVPRCHDSVRVHAVECEPSDFNRKCNWRATRVVPKGVGAIREAPMDCSHLQNQSFLDELTKDKFDIHIEDEIQVGCVQKGQSVSQIVQVFNYSKVSQASLLKIQIQGRESQLTRQLTVQVNENIFPLKIVPRSKALIKMQCFGNDFGLTKILATFHFKLNPGSELEQDFAIGTRIVMDVRDALLDSLQLGIEPKLPRFHGANFNVVQSKDVIRGQRKRSQNGPIFTKKRLQEYPIPKRFASIYYEDDPSALLDHFPYLGEDLCIANYKDKFANLLYLEELEQLEQMSQYCLNQVTFQVQGPYLALEVPGLAEKRPSLAIGDAAIATLSNQVGQEPAPKFEGCIHEVRSGSVLLMFDQRFHQVYCGEIYDIEFKMSRSQMKKMHQAIDEVVKNFGENVLFPMLVTSTTPQVDFVLDNPVIRYGKFQAPATKKVLRKSALKTGKSLTGTPLGAEWMTPKLPLNLKEAKLSKNKIFHKLDYEFKLDKADQVLPYFTQDMLDNLKSGQIVLKWVNSALNPEQKNAVMRILSGQARPLPYIIYGPPGTGKTVTVVEAIIQIFKLRSDSR